MKCKPYSKITVEIGTQLKTVKITLNIFAVYIFPFIVLSSKTILLIIIGLKNDVTSQKSKLVAGFDEQDIFNKFVARKKKSNMTPKFSRTQSTAVLCISCFFSYKKRRENCWV